MGAIENIKPTFFGSTIENDRDVENTINLAAVKDPEATMATVMMTQLHDTRLETQFNRLQLMGQNDKVTRTFPLRRKLNYIGRSRSCQVRIKDPLISVKHLTASVSSDSCVINDLNSSNGTFINGERLVGGRVLQDGDEIMLGKTILRFAARETGAAVGPGNKPKHRAALLNKKRVCMLAAAVLCLVMSVTLVYQGTHLLTDHSADKTHALPQAKQNSNSPASGEPATASMSAADFGKKAEIAPRKTQPAQDSHIQRALTEYAAGRLSSAMKTLNMLSTAKEGTPAGLQAKSILAMVRTVQELHVQALKTQKENKFAAALEIWDRLLAVDMELVGERPSYFAAQAEQRVQALSYEHALDAYQEKNHKKVRQLCLVILRINPKHPEALTLLAKVQPKA